MRPPIMVLSVPGPPKKTVLGLDQAQPLDSSGTLYFSSSTFFLAPLQPVSCQIHMGVP